MGNRWNLSREKINHFRTSLENPLTSQLFRRYVSGKGDWHENNVLFWQEATKYKVSPRELLTLRNIWTLANTNLIITIII